MLDAFIAGLTSSHIRLNFWICQRLWELAERNNAAYFSPINSLSTMSVSGDSCEGETTQQILIDTGSSGSFIKFIGKDVFRLLSGCVIDLIKSTWRAQVLIVNSGGSKKRMVVDYSQTINRFTQCDAYPLLQIDSMANRLAQFKICSTLNPRWTYNQIPILYSFRGWLQAVSVP